MYYYPLHRYLVTRDYEICLFYGKLSIPCFFGESLNIIWYLDLMNILEYLSLE